VPSRIAVAASDDHELMQATVPAITAVQYPRYQLGTLAAEVIVERARGAAAGAVRHDVGFRIVGRAST